MPVKPRRRVHGATDRAGPRDHARSRVSSTAHPYQAGRARIRVTAVAVDRGTVRVGIAFDVRAGDDRGIRGHLAAPRLRVDERYGPGRDRRRRRRRSRRPRRAPPPDRPARTPSLRWLQVLSAGVEGLLGPDAPRGRRGDRPDECPRRLRHVRSPSTRSRRYSTWPNTVDARREQQALGTLAGRPRTPLTGRPIRGKTLVIVGYGGIGREIARLAVGSRDAGARGQGEPVGPRRRRIPGAGNGRPGRARSPSGSSASTELAARSRRSRLRLDHAAADRAEPRDRQPGGPRRAAGSCLDRQHRTRARGRRDRPRRDARGGSHRGRRPRRVRRGAVAAGESVLGAAQRRRSRPTCRAPARRSSCPTLVAENLRRFVDGRTLLNRVDPERGY